LLPEVLVNYFALTNPKAKREELHFYFKEQQEQAQEYAFSKLRSKRFLSRS
jgi:hypothetical protein